MDTFLKQVEAAVDDDVTFAPFLLGQNSRVSLQAVWDGDLEGEFQFDVSNYNRPMFPNTEVDARAEYTLLVSPAAFADQQPDGDPSGGLKGMFGFADVGEASIRARFVHSSGDGNVTLFWHSKP